MTFRKVGGVQYSATQNVVKSRYNISNQSYISQYVGEPNTVIEFLSDISGNLSDGIVGIANNISGGTTGDILYQSATDITSKLHIGVSGEILTSNGMNPYWAPTFDLSMVLSKGNSVGPYGINMNAQNILNAMTIYATTFTGALSGNATTATNATKVATTADNTNGAYFIPFTKTATSSETLYVDSNTTGLLTYNPSTSNLSATTFTGALSGNATTATNATNQANGVQIPAMYFFYAHITGGGTDETGTFTFPDLGTNYMVFSSIYYGYSGSSGVYNAINSSSAINTMIIFDIRTTQFSWVFKRSTGDNLSVYAVFMLVCSPSLNFPKSY
jgi:hypothetical protein